MAAYFIKYRYVTYNGIVNYGNCVINYEKFEKVDEGSFYKKFNEKIDKKYFRNTDATIEDVIKL